jgi:hypothetical protein
MKSYYFFASSILLRCVYVNRKNIHQLFSLLTDKLCDMFGEKKSIENPKSAIEKYIDLHSDRFLKTYESTNTYNDNIDSCFYEKDKLKEILKLESKINELEMEWKRRILYESTPRGNIIMYYDPYKLGFVYYCDTNTISYPLLNAAAMKYCLAYRCRDFFVDNEITPFKTPSALIPIHYIEPPKKKNKETKTTINNSVFAKLKDYSKKTEKTESKQTNKQDDTDKEKDVVGKIENKDKCKNRFIYMGKLYNINLLQRMKKPANKMNGFSSQYLDDFNSETRVQDQVLSYKDYKKTTTKIPFKE